MESTSVFPRVYYTEEMDDIDPRFYAEKDMVVLDPHPDIAVPPPEGSIVLPASIRVEIMVSRTQNEE